MSRQRVPSYRHHKPSGQAVVTLDGRDFYLGPWNSKASRSEYERLTGEWSANGRRIPSDGDRADLRIASCWPRTAASPRSITSPMVSQGRSSCAWTR